jgi:hypothetical protein
MRSDTSSFTPGSAGGGFGGASIGFAVAALKACSAAERGSVGRRAILASHAELIAVAGIVLQLGKDGR